MKNSSPHVTSRPRLDLRLTAVLLGIFTLGQARANVDFDFNMWHGYDFYYASADLVATNPSPTTYHRVESPNGVIWQNVGSNNDGSSSSLSLTNDFSVLLNECTNGLWTLTLNAGDPSETEYTFSMAANITTGTFGNAAITAPFYGELVTTNQPNIQWTGPAQLPMLTINISSDGFPYTLHDFAMLPSTTTSWTPTVPIPPGMQSIFLSYTSNNYAGITLSTPTNTVGGAVLPGWSARSDIATYSYSTFTVPGSGGEPGFDEAVESPGLVWTTGGDSGGWFVQSNETYFSASALQSGPVLDYESSWVETTVQGPGTLLFNWNMLADYNDFFELTVSNLFGEYGDWSAYGYEGGFWDNYEVYLEPGPNTLRWTFWNDDTDANDMDAAFLDWIEYYPIVDYEAEFELNIQRVTRGTNSYYVMFPRLMNVYPPASTSHEVFSPNYLSSGDDSGSSSSAHYDTLADLVSEIQGGDWFLSFNVDSSSYREYYFTISTNALSTNTIPPVLVFDPPNGATGVATNTSYSWLGPPDFDSLTVLVRDVEASSTLGFSTLPPVQTSWTAGPGLPEGTNSFTATYTSNNFMGLTISDPVDLDYYPLNSWSTSVELSTSGHSQFETVAGFVALPVTLLPPVFLSGDMALSFISQSGALHMVECTTNLVSGPWLPVTNFTGTGVPEMLTMPATNPAAFYRVETQ